MSELLYVIEARIWMHPCKILSVRTHLICAPGIQSKYGESEDHSRPGVVGRVGGSKYVERIFWREATRSVVVYSNIAIRIVGSGLHELMAHTLETAHLGKCLKITLIL